MRDPSAIDQGVNAGHNDRGVSPGAIADVHGKILADGVANVGQAENVDIVGERAEGKFPKKEEISELSSLILGKNVTLPVGTLLRLIPLLPRILVQDTKGRRLEGPQEARNSRTGQAPIGDVVMKDETQKVFLQASKGVERGLGRARGGLIEVPARVGRARMRAVVDSGAMLDVISERMFISSGLARNNDTSMQIGDVNGGSEGCLGVIRNATIYLTESELPTVADLWVHKNTDAYDLLLGRKWATMNWAGTSEKPEGTYLKFASNGENYSVNAVPNPRFAIRDQEPDDETRGMNATSTRTPEPRKIYMVEAKEEKENKRDYERESDSPPTIETYRRRQTKRNEKKREKKRNGEGNLNEEGSERRPEERREETYPVNSKEKQPRGTIERNDAGNSKDEVWEERWEESDEEREGEGPEGTETSEESSDLYEWSAEDLIRAILDGVEPSRTPRAQGHLEKNKLNRRANQDHLKNNELRPETKRKRLAIEGLAGERKDETPDPIDSDEEWEGITQDTKPLPSRLVPPRRTTRTRNESWESRQVQWDRQYERASNLRITGAASGNGSQRRGARILLSITKEGPDLARNGIKSKDDENTASSEINQDKNPLTTKVCWKPADRSIALGSMENVSGSQTNFETSSSPCCDPSYEALGVNTWIPETRTCEATKGWVSLRRNGGANRPIKEAGEGEETDPETPPVLFRSPNSSLTQRCARLDYNRTHNTSVNGQLAALRSHQALSTFSRLIELLSHLYPIRKTVTASLFKHQPRTTLMSNHENSAPVQDVMAESQLKTLSVAPPRNFFRTMFEGSSQGSIVPITYGTDGEAQSRIDQAEEQIRKVSNKIDDCSPATVRISHLHHLMVHDSENGNPVRDFLGMGTLILSSNPSGPKLAFTGDLFIRFVPRMIEDVPFPHVPYPDPHQVLQAHQVLVPHVTFDDDPFIDISHSHSIRRLPTPFNDKRIGSKLANVADEIKSRVRAALGTKPPESQPLLESGNEGDSEPTSSTDSESSSVSDSEIDELADDDLLQDAPPIPRDAFIQPLPAVENDGPPTYSTMEPNISALGDSQPRSEDVFSYENYLAETFPYRYFNHPNRIVSDSTDSIPALIPDFQNANMSESFFPTPVVTTDDGRTFIPMEVNQNNLDQGTLAPYVVADPYSPPGYQGEEARMEPNPFLNSGDPMKLEAPISHTTQELLKAADNPTAKNLLTTAIVAQNPFSDAESGEDMVLDSPTPAPAPNPFRNQGRSRFGPPLDPQAPPFQPGSLKPNVPDTRSPDPSSKPFRVPEPTIAPPQTFPVTAHFFTSVTNRLTQAENRTSKVEEDIRTSQTICDGLREEIKDDQKRIGELSWLYPRIEASEKHQREIDGKIANIIQDGTNPAFKRSTNFRLAQTGVELDEVKDRINRREAQVGRDIAQLKKTVQQIQVKNTVDRATALKDIVDLRGTVFTEYKNRLSSLERSVKLIFAQVKRANPPKGQANQKPCRQYPTSLPNFSQNFLPSFTPPFGPYVCA